MKKKMFLAKIQFGSAAYMNIAINTDGKKPVYVYYCGRGTGKRYINIGSASRYLEKIAAAWEKNNRYNLQIRKVYTAAENIPVYGSDKYNIDSYKRGLK